jgi:hypothetical protein
LLINKNELMDLEEFEENKIGKKVGKNHMIEDKHKI